jgi:seryl-tRNA(Sec) selenium transferase
MRPSLAVVGAGAAPAATLPSWAVVLPGDASTALRNARPFPVIARVSDGSTWIDLRSVDESNDRYIIDALIHLRQ